MSCFPDILVSRSQPLSNPAKIGGVYSIHLASVKLPKPRLSMKNQPNATQRIFSRSLGNKQNRTWRELDDSFRKSQWTTRRSFYGREEAIEEREVRVDNINAKGTQQIEIEFVASFNQTKKAVLEGVHLANRSLELSGAQCEHIRKDLGLLRELVEQNVEDLKTSLSQAFGQLLAEFRREKRNTIEENKTLNKQLAFLTEDFQTVRLLTEQSEARFKGVTRQFM